MSVTATGTTTGGDAGPAAAARRPPGTYRRRLLAAAVASLTLHLLLARGLAVTNLGLDGNRPADTAPKQPLKPRVKVDYALQASQSPATAKPAHERPLRVELESPTLPRTQPQRPDKTLTERRQREAAEVAVASRSRLERISAPREPAAAPAATPTRESAAAPAPTSAAAAAAPIAPATASASAAPRPAPITPREREPAAPVSVRWQPREVALLERLAAGSPAVTSRPQATEPALPAAGRSTALARPGVDANIAAAATAAAVEPAAVVTQPTASEPAAPQPRTLTARSAREAVAAATRTTADNDPAEPATDSIAARAAPFTPPVPARSFAGAAGPAGGTVAPALERQAAAGSGGDSTPATIDMAVAAAPSPPAAADGSGSGGVGVDRAVPAAVGRAADRYATRSAPTAVRSARNDLDAGADDGEGLSVSLVEASSGPRMVAIRPEGGVERPGLETAALERVGATVLPTEGRVRDVSEAFARRAPDRRTDRQGGTPGGKSAALAARADAIVERGLDFLARSQQEDGRWSLGRFAGVTAADVPKLQSDTAATGLALLSFLGAGHDHFDGPHSDTVRRGLQFLLAAQRPDGDLYVPADELSNSCSWLYSHGIAAIALCEAVGMTGDPLVRPAAENACRFIATSQHPERGGWRYTPRSDADLSVSGWMLVAVRSGQLGGVKTDPRTLDGVVTLLEAATAPSDPTRYAYNPRNPQQRPSRLSAACMTAVGTLMRLHTGWKATDSRVTESARVLAAMRPSYGTSSDRTRDSYLWYYASQVLVHTGGAGWDAWYRSLVDVLEAKQQRAGATAGSWDPLGPVPDRWGQYGGRIYVTALHLLALEVPDRHLPTYNAAR